ncbi:MAG: MTH1187 family thiamine-binding protein [Candidatus Korarchaeum sp.]|nr:MTH1187 family thiamine-binding protein [Candidatus Korarchaeum sp.]MDW8035758.1 MTH1187 family thiamine-binding protein [Candidatus Korarchaeum sp.]
MVMAEVTIVPIGVGSSLSDYVAEAISVALRSGLKVRITPTSTILEGDLGDLMRVIREMHESQFLKGAPRVLTIVKIDERRDKEVNMEYKVEVVEEKIKKGTGVRT